MDMKKLYSYYVRKYDDTARRMKGRGMKMYIPKLNREEFEVMYEAEKIEMTKKKASSKALDTEIADNIVQNQRHELSDAQISAFRKGMKELYGEDWSVKKVHIEGADFLRKMNEEFKKSGIEDSAERALLISQGIFGSP